MPFIPRTILNKLQFPSKERKFKLLMETTNMAGLFTQGTILYLKSISPGGAFGLADEFGNGLLLNAESAKLRLEEILPVETQTSPNNPVVPVSQ